MILKIYIYTCKVLWFEMNKLTFYNLVFQRKMANINSIPFDVLYLIFEYFYKHWADSWDIRVVSIKSTSFFQSTYFSKIFCFDRYVSLTDFPTENMSPCVCWIVGGKIWLPLVSLHRLNDTYHLLAFGKTTCLFLAIFKVSGCGWENILICLCLY